MVYRIKADKKEELCDGRKQTAIAEIIGRTPTSVNYILQGRYNCDLLIAKVLISIKEQVPINDKHMLEYVDYYFEKIYKD